jgi:hypothetical protein
MALSTAFNNISVIYRCGQFYWWRAPELPEKTTDLSQVTDKLLLHNVGEINILKNILDMLTFHRQLFHSKNICPLLFLTSR